MAYIGAITVNNIIIALKGLASVKQKLFVVLTILGLMSFVLMYYLMDPKTISESSAVVIGKNVFGSFVQFLYNVLDMSCCILCERSRLLRLQEVSVMSSSH